MARILLIAGSYFAIYRIGLYLAGRRATHGDLAALGKAVGALILFGWRYWPGILAGSFLLNCHISGACSPETGADPAKAATGLAIVVARRCRRWPPMG